eukprot:gnl/Chilomastix_caulleri/5932.p1 GENE.gnl/Chilomastix_caulleri/5932~~gnl/Chilomastix_caulleri/5932.p1  ORF type:complete len:137 (+),score=20.54 gnl/Chilomastix_caulleri/5932:15-425(+)
MKLWNKIIILIAVIDGESLIEDILPADIRLDVRFDCGIGDLHLEGDRKATPAEGHGRSQNFIKLRAEPEKTSSMYGKGRFMLEFDTSWKLEDIDMNHFISSVQLSFLCAMLGNDFEAFEVWMKLYNTFCNSESFNC